MNGLVHQFLLLTSPASDSELHSMSAGRSRKLEARAFVSVVEVLPHRGWPARLAVCCQQRDEFSFSPGESHSGPADLVDPSQIEVGRT